jgi:hypothetical protein
MPYIVTTKRPEDGEFLNPVNGQSKLYGPTESTSCQAVVTLEEAMRECWRQAPDYVPATMHRQFNCLPESGGTVGPLPDGTRIEVEQRKRSALYRELPTIVQARFGSWANMTDEQVCSAWNANYAREGAAH